MSWHALADLAKNNSNKAWRPQGPKDCVQNLDIARKEMKPVLSKTKAKHILLFKTHKAMVLQKPTKFPGGVW
jgi:hypothetical protein